MRPFVSLLLIPFTLFTAVLTFAQTATSPAPPPLVTTSKPGATPTIPKADGVQIAVVNDVSTSITVDAVLLPSSTAKRIFGKAVSDNYAVVEMIISNHNQDAALIIQSALLDYSHWLFSNNFQAPLQRSNSIVTTQFQQANNPSQVASAEARLVRGDLQDAQFWTARNAFIRAITAVGTIASGYQFLATSQNYTAGISAFGNQVVPALATFWPDPTQLQINRISDFGFQTNHVIPKGGSDIVVAFFPLDRFLTPSLRKLFIKSPAIFFVPGEMLIDGKYRPMFIKMLQNAGVIEATDKDDAAAKKVATALGNYEAVRAAVVGLSGDEAKKITDAQCKPTTASTPILSADDCRILGVMDKLSLNNIRLVIGGVMTIDTNAIPAVIDSVTIANDSKADTWKSGATVQGTIAGSFLGGGIPSVAEGASSGAGSVSGSVMVDQKQSSDKEIFFSFALTKDVPSDTKLEFTVTKQAKDGSSSSSKPFEVLVKYAAATIDSVTITDDASKADTWKSGSTVHGVIAGSLLSGGVPSVAGSAASDVGNFVVDPKNSDDKKITFSFTLTKDVPSDTKLEFIVTTKAKDGSSTPSKQVEVLVKYTAATPVKTTTDNNPSRQKGAPDAKASAKPPVGQKPKPKPQTSPTPSPKGL
jgi:hypothetical protein